MVCGVLKEFVVFPEAQDFLAGREVRVCLAWMALRDAGGTLDSLALLEVLDFLDRWVAVLDGTSPSEWFNLASPKKIAPKYLATSYIDQFN